MNAHPKLATVQVDMDPFWFIDSCSKVDAGVQPSEERTIYETAAPLLLDAFRRHGIRATFFVVGRDFNNPRNLPWLDRILKEGHELANHTYMHRVDFKKLSFSALREEVDLCSERMKSHLGITPKGFKAPAYAVSPALLKHLTQFGYLYDSSVHPNVAIPLVKAIQNYWLGYVKSEFGNLGSIVSPLFPYNPGLQNPYRPGNSSVLEIPVSTIPLLRLPFHFSFVNVSSLALYSFGIKMHELFGPGFVNYAFHAVDVLDRRDTPCSIHHRPGMSKSRETKLLHLDKILSDLTKRYKVLATEDVAHLYNTKLHQ